MRILNRPLTRLGSPIEPPMRYFVLAFLCAIAVISYVQRTGLNAVKDAVCLDLGIGTDAERFGALGSAWLVGYALLQVPAGWFADRFGGRNVLVVDDIVDHGRTMAFLHRFLADREPASLRSCALFDRPARRDVDVRLDYVGVAIPNVFAIGYGLDHKELYRNLPYVAELREGRTV